MDKITVGTKIIVACAAMLTTLRLCEGTAHAWGWIGTDGQTSAGPAVVTRSIVPGQLDVFVRGLGPSFALWHRSLDDNGFVGLWDANAGSPPGGLASRPAAIYQQSSGAGERWNVVGLSGSTLYYTYWQGSNGNWITPWLPLPNGVLTTGAALTLNSNNRIDVWAAGQGPQRGIWHTWILADGGTPTLPGSWDGQVGAPTSPLGVKAAPSAFARTVGQTDIVVQSADDGYLWHRNYDGSSWSTWTRLPQFFETAAVEPALTSNAPGQLDVYARGAGGVLWHTSFSTRQPSNLVWDAAVGTPQNPGPSTATALAAGYGVAAIAGAADVVSLFGVDSNSNLYLRRYNKRWAKVPAPFPEAGGLQSLQLLMDGTVMASSTAVRHHWYRFSASPSGGFLGGSWTLPGQILDSRFGKQCFATAMLSDGRYLVAGGEYVYTTTGTITKIADADVPDPKGNHNRVDIYDPLNNNWMPAPDYPCTNSTTNVDAPCDGTAGLADTYFADAVSAPLPSPIGGGVAKILFGSPSGAGSFSREFDPAVCPRDQACFANPWGPKRNLNNAPPSFTSGFGEGSFSFLPNGQVFLTAGRVATYDVNSGWSQALAAPAISPFNVDGGSALTLYDGRVLILGGETRFNAIFNVNYGTNVNVASIPTMPVANVDGSTDENGQVVMPNGNVLVAVHSNSGVGYKRLFEFNPTAQGTGTFTDVSVGGPDCTAGVPCGGDLVQTPLPDGSVLVATDNSPDLYIYSPPGPQLTAFGVPTISQITGPVGQDYTLTGTTLNGVTNGANRDDEGHNYTSFPIVSMTTTNGETRYAQVISVSTTSIMAGTAGTVKFRLPANWTPSGTVTVRVSASGLMSSNYKNMNF